MSSTWKLTKKLKEAHIASAFLRVNSGGGSGSSADASRSDTLIPDRNAKEGSGAKSRGTVTAVDRGMTRLKLDHVEDNASPEFSPTSASAASVTSGNSVMSGNSGTSSTSLGEDGPSSSTNPALLRVKIYELHGLTMPPSVEALLPSWVHEKGSTRPPPLHVVLEYDKTQVLLHAIGGTVESPIWDKTSAFDVSRSEPPLNIQVYVRVSNRQCSDEEREPELAQATSDNNGGPSCSSGQFNSSMNSISPVKDVLLAQIQLPTHAPINETVALRDNTGKLRIRCEIQQTRNQPLTIDDFQLLKVVGKGSFGKVMQVRKKDTQQIYALKTLRKAHIVSRSEVGHTLAERTVLAKINNPFIVPLKFSFQSPEKLYLVLAFVNGGELFHHLQREGRFDLNRARFYTAELLCALECLHEYNVIYRDLKPENILLDYTGHIALCDFGLCKLNMANQEKTNTFCGTPEYLAPELLLGQGYTRVVDWWTLGVLFYEMITGLPPFYDQDTNTMYHKILQDPLTFPSDMDRGAQSLLKGLLNRDPKCRLGVNGAAEIKAHPFFRQIDWKYLLNKKYAAPFQPSVVSATDTSNFDKEFTSEVPMDSVVDKDFYLSESVQKQFGGWSYTSESKLAFSGRW